MLPTPAQHRLYRHIDDLSPLDITYYAPDGTARQAAVPLDVFWANEDYTATYPAVALRLDPTSVQRYEGGRLTDTVRKVARPDDPTVAYERLEGTQLYDVLHVTVAVRDDHDGIPRSALAKEIAQNLFASLRFETDYLQEPGVAADGSPLYGDDAPVDALDWSQPMVVEPVPGTGITRNPAMLDEQTTMRYEMQFRVNYELTHSVLVDAVEAIEYDVYVDGEVVTRETVGTGTPTVAGFSPLTATRDL